MCSPPSWRRIVTDDIATHPEPFFQGCRAQNSHEEIERVFESRNSRQESCTDGLVGREGERGWCGLGLGVLQLGSPVPPSTKAEPHPRSLLCTQGWSSPTSCAGGLTPTTPFNQGGGVPFGCRRSSPSPGALSPCLDSYQGSGSSRCCCRDAQA